MGDTAQDGRNALFMGSLIGSGVGFLLLILTDFAGWYSYSYYYGIGEWGYVGPNSPLGFLMMFILGLPLLYCAVISLQGVRNPDSITQGTVSRAFKLSVLQLAVVFVGAIAFVIAVSGADDWWFGAGFYGSAIGGVLTVICLSSARKSYTRTVPASTPYLPGAMQSFPQGQPQQYPPSYPQQQSDAMYGPQSASQPMGYAPASSMPQPYPQQVAPAPRVESAPSQQLFTGSPGSCPRCGNPLPSGVRFCRACGSAVQ